MSNETRRNVPKAGEAERQSHTIAKTSGGKDHCMDERTEKQTRLCTRKSGPGGWTCRNTAHTHKEGRSALPKRDGPWRDGSQKTETLTRSRAYDSSARPA